MALIDRDRLLTERMKSKYYHLPNGDIAVPLIDIEHAPVVDAVPVVHGHWIKFGVSDKDGNHQYRCSVCECEDIHSPLVKVNYCWNCGARMDGKDGDS